MTSPMRVRRIDCFLNRQPFQVAFVSLHAERREASGVLLRLETDSGLVGWGEGTPRAYVSGETCDGVIAQIEHRFAPALFAAEFETASHLQDLLASLAALTPLSDTVVGTAALGAVDLALWDLLGQAYARPVHSFFVQKPLALPPLSLSVPILPVEQLRHFYPLAVEMAVERFKLVLSDAVGENVSRLSMLRELAGERAFIAVDANGKLTPGQVKAMLPDLLPFGIAALEQPAGKTDLNGLRSIRDATSLPITLDETVCTLADARHVIDLGLCDTINLKLSKCGGLHATRQIHELAHRQGVACQLGSHVGETPILAAAGEAAARILPDLRFMEIGSTLLDPCPALQPAAAQSQAPGPGLGLSFSTESVANHFGPPVLSLHP